MASEPNYPLTTEFLADRGQAAADVARQIAGFFAQASTTLDVAIYDFRLDDTCAPIMLKAFQDAVSRGVAVRLVFNVEPVRKSPDPPPSEVDWDLIHRLGVPFQPIRGVPDLMHHKYVVRDAASGSGAVLTGSTNWTTDSWTREENVILSVRSPEVAIAFTDNFNELWEKRDVASSGFVTAGTTTLFGDGERIRVRPHFCPGGADDLVDEIAARVKSATTRLRVCSPVITASPILNALKEVVDRRTVPLVGAYDGTQMAEVRNQWSEEPQARWKIAAFDAVTAGGAFGAKSSVPYSKGSVHDFMHAKILVADDCVFTGSFNLSHSGESNAENVLQIESSAIAESFAKYVEATSVRYRRVAAGGAPAN